MSPEPFGRRWGRRALSFSLYALLAGASWTVAPVVLPVLAGVDLVADRRMPRLRAAVFFLLHLAAEWVSLVAAAFVWLTRRPVLPANAAIQRGLTNFYFHAVARLYGMKVEVEGAELVHPTPFLLFVRHSSTADTALAAGIVANPNHLLLRYVLKRELLWDPCVDVLGQRLPNRFVDRSGRNRDTEVAAVASLAAGLGPGEGVAIYPEGSRFTPARLARAKAALAGGPLADLAARFTSVLPPKPGGALALLDAAPGLDVLVLDHVGLEDAVSLASFWRGGLIGRTLHARLRRIPRSRIPPQGRERWLFEQWLETDRWVAART